MSRLTGFRTFSVRTQLVLLVLIVIVPLLAWQGIELNTRYRTLYRHEVEANLEIARAVARTFAGFVDSVLRFQAGIIIAVSEKGHTPEEISRILTDYEKITEVVLNIGWLSTECRVVASSNPKAIGMDLSDRPHLLRVAQGADWSIGNLIIGRATKLPVFHICKAVRDDSGNLKGILVASIDEEHLAKELAFKRGGSAGISLMDRNGMLVFRSPKLQLRWEERNWLRDYPFIQESLEGREYTGAHVVKYDGQARVVANVPLPFGWVAGASRQEQEVTGTILSQMRSSLVTFAVLLAAAVFAVVYLSRQIAKSVNLLQAKSDAIGRGDYTTHEYHSATREFQELSSTLDRMARMITEREDALRQSKERLQRFELIAHHSRDIILFVDYQSGQLLEANEAAASAYSYSRDELLKLTIQDLRAPNTRTLAAAQMQTAFASGIQFETEHRRKDGSTFPVEVSSQGAIIDGQQTLISVIRDISERKQIEAALRESEARFRLALKNSPVLVAMQDTNLVYQWAFNTRTRQAEDVVGKTDADLFAPEDLPSILEAKRGVLQTGEVVRNAQWLTSNGQRVFLDCYYEPVRDSAGKIIGVGIAAVNLTEQMGTEEALRESEKRYRALFDSMTEGFALHEIVTDEQGQPVDYRFIDVNPAFERLTGLRRSDLLGKRVLEVLPGTEAHWIDSYGRVALTGEPDHFENYSAILDRWFAVYAYRPAPRQFAVVFTDITSRRQAEEGLAAAHRQIQNIIDNTPDLVYALDLEERFVMANAALAALLNSTPEQIIGKKRHEFMPKEDAEWHEANDRQVIEAGRMLEFEEYSQLKGRSITWLTKKFPLRDAQGRIYTVAGISADITERKQAEEALRESEAKYRNLFENMTEEVHFWQVVRDKAGRIKTWRLVDVNPPTLKTWGRSTAEEIRGKTTDEIFGPGATDHYMPVVQKIMTEGIPYSFEDYFPNLNKYFRFTSVPLGDYFITTGADITDIKKALEALRESEERWAITLSSIGDAVIAADTNGRVTFMNPVAENLTGWMLSEAAGKPVKEVFRIVNEQTRAVVDDPVSKVLRTGLIAGLANHTVLLRRGGGELPIDDSGAPIRNAEGDILGVVLIFRDITERKAAEETLRESEEQFRVLAQNLVSAVALVNERGEISIVNQSFLRLFELDEDADILNINSRDWSQWQVFDETGRLLDVNEHPVRKAGRTRVAVRDVLVAMQCPGRTDRKWVLISAEPILDAQGNLHRLICTYHDITAHKQAEEALREREKELVQAQRVAQIGSWTWDARTDTGTASNALLCIFGFDPATQTIPNFADQRGRWYPPEEWDRLNAAVQESFRTGVGYSLELQALRRGERIWVHTRSEAVRDAQGRIVGLRGSVQDITERRQAEEELRQLNATLEQRVAERTQMAEMRARQLQALAMELVEAEEVERRRIAQLLHDDLQQNLAAARMQLQSASECYPAATDELANVEKILGESLGKARRLSHELSPAVLHHSGLSASMEWLARQMKDQFGLSVRLETLDTQQLDSTQLKVFLFRAAQELLFNVVKHAGVKIARLVLSRLDGRLVLTVSDQGRGFDPNILNSPTSKSGFGLLSIRERANYVGGDLTIQSDPGKGSRLTLTVPIGMARAEKMKHHAAAAPVEPLTTPSEGGIRVMFVDDHDIMRKGLIRLMNGQPVIEVVGEASNGQEAIERVRQLRPDVVVMDVSMPGMDGIEATRRIKAEWPAVRVVGLSMYDDEHVSQEMRAAGAETLMSKTASPAELLKAIYGSRRPHQSMK